MTGPLNKLLWVLARLVPGALRRWLALWPFRRAHARLMLPMGEQHRHTLGALVDANRTTSFGSQHQFETVSTISDYTTCVPVSDLASLSSAITAQAQPTTDDGSVAEPPPLTRERIRGRWREERSGHPMLITDRTLELWRWAEQLLERELVERCPEALRGSWLHLLPLHRPIKVNGGVPELPVSALLRVLDAERLDERYPIPEELFTIASEPVRFYLVLRLAMVQNVTLLRAAAPGTLRLLFDYLTEHGARLTEHIATGEIAHLSELTQRIRIVVSPHQQPRPELAARLRDILRHRPLTPRDVWPTLCAAVCQTGGAAHHSADQLRRDLEPLALFDEGIRCGTVILTGPAVATGRAGGSLLSFNQHVEFERHTDDGVQVIDSHQLGSNTPYVPIVSAPGGLYRCRLPIEVELGERTQAGVGLHFRGMANPAIELTPGVIIDAECAQRALAEACREVDQPVVDFVAWRHVPDTAARPPEGPTKGEPTSALDTPEGSGWWARINPFRRRSRDEMTGDARQDAALPQLVVALEPRREELAPDQLEALASALDAALSARLESYAKARSASTLTRPSLSLVPRGWFAESRRAELAAGHAAAHEPHPILRPDPIPIGMDPAMPTSPAPAS